jgi:hypothetical protein
MQAKTVSALAQRAFLARQRRCFKAAELHLGGVHRAGEFLFFGSNEFFEDGSKRIRLTHEAQVGGM